MKSREKKVTEVIDTGPYGLVRHPIYTGLIAAILATGVAVGTVTAILGAVLISFGLSVKARAEENFLTSELDPSAYNPTAAGSLCLYPSSLTGSRGLGVGPAI